MPDNLAYDLSLFERRKKKPDQQKKTPPKALPQSPLRTAAILFVRIVTGAAVGLVISSCLYSRAILTETYDRITKANERLGQLQSESTRLGMELDGKVSIKNIEDYATQKLGLNRMDKYQTTYITLAGDDKIEETVLAQKEFELPDLNELFYMLVEYIN